MHGVGGGGWAGPCTNQERGQHRTKDLHLLRIEGLQRGGDTVMLQGRYHAPCVRLKAPATFTTRCPQIRTNECATQSMHKQNKVSARKARPVVMEPHPQPKRPVDTTTSSWLSMMT